MKLGQQPRRLTHANDESRLATLLIGSRPEMLSHMWPRLRNVEGLIGGAGLQLI